MAFLTISLGVLGTLVTVYTIYYLFISLAIIKPLPDLPPADDFHRLAVVIPARNEARVIGQLLDSLQRQDYPREWFDIYVVANHCTDDTVAISLASGANVHFAPASVRSKGEALHYFFEAHYRYDQYDGYIVFDADNLAAADFLSRANRAICAGITAMVGHRDSKNPTASAIASCYTIFYYLFNRLYNRPRTVRGMNALITGTGFMLTKEHLRSLGGWHTQTLIEDAEITLQSALHGLSIRYEPAARFYDEQPTDFLTSWHQRLRWSVGSQQNMRWYGRECLTRAIAGWGKDAFDHWLMLLATYMQICGVIALGLSLAIGLYHPAPQPGDIGYLIGFGLSGMIGLPTVLAFLAVRLEKKPVRAMLAGISLFWLFMLSWMPIHSYALIKRTIDWKPIRHDATRSIEEMIE